MTHDCITDQQGRLPCTCKLHTANSDNTSPHGDPWGWVDQIFDRAALVVVAAVIVAAAAVVHRIFN